MSRPSVDKIFIIVSKDKESDRYAYIQKYLDSHPEFKSLTEIVEPFWKGRDEHLFTNQAQYDKCARGGMMMVYETQLNILRRFIEDLDCAGYSHIMVCESDCIFSDDFLDRIKEFRAQWDTLGEANSMLYPGSGCGLTPRQHNKKTDNLYEENSTCSGECYIVTRKSAKSIYTMTRNEPLINMVLDHYWNRVIKEMNIKSYWARPHVVYQGSFTGLYKSHLASSS
jgi:hypothetical protein